VPANFGRDEGAEYVARANRQVFVSVQIETVEAVKAIEDIVAVSGLDSIVLGPWDLSMSMGLPGEVEHPAMVEAIDVVIRTARAAGLAVGTGMGTDPEYAVRMARRGVQWVQLGADFGHMIRSVDELSERIRRDLEAPADSR
jgi:2-keto-3-deoxy-L-rhamnonate aldolase RhmA